MPTMADRVLDQLRTSDVPLDDDQLALALGTRREHINNVCRRLQSKGFVVRSRPVGGKIVNRLADSPSTAVAEPSLGVGVLAQSLITGLEFEAHARGVLERHWGVRLRSQVVTLTTGVKHSFDFVSDDETIVGDAKYYRDLPVPAAKFSTISEYVWLLQHVPGQRRFLVFGNSRRIPERWLKRFKPLLGGVEFWFLDGERLDRLPDSV